MARRATKDEFIQNAINVHGNRYDYSFVEYVNNRTKVKIICCEHGEFFIAPAGHTGMRYGCIECGGTRKKTTEEFVDKANKLHNNKYDYTKTQYTNTSSEVIIICPTHGEFIQTPFAHLQSLGCKECSLIQTIDTKIIAGLIPPRIRERTEYENYIKLIRRFTGRSYKNYKDKINPNNLQLAHQNGYHLDHIYSKIQGFHDNVPPEIIGHWTNLRIIPGLYNITKNSKCDKTLDQLYEDYNREKEIK